MSDNEDQADTALESSESEAQAHQAHHARVVRSLRRGAGFVGIPLTLALVVPWRLGYRGTQFSWDIAERFDHIGFVLLPACGLLFLAAAFGPKLRYETRARIVGFAGVATVGIALALMHLPTVRPIGRLWLYAPYMLLLMPIFAVAAEMSMHMRPRSRGLTLLALVGWIGAFVLTCTPMEPDLDFDSSMLGQSVRAMGRYYGNKMLPALMAPGYLLVFLGVSQALRRIGKDRDEAAEKRFRTSWLAYLLYPVPMVVVATVAMIAQLDDPDDLVEIFVPFACAFGVMFGGALGLCHLMVLANDHEPIRSNLKRGAFAVVLATVVIMAIRWVMPDRRDAHVAELQWSMAEALCDALEGEPVEGRFLGGYSEFDLRSAPSVVDAPEGTTFEPVLFALRVTGAGRYARAVALGPDTLRWAAGGSQTYGNAGQYERASPALAEAITRLSDASSATGCLPELSESDVEGMPQPAQRLLARDPSEICDDDTNGSGRGRRFRDAHGSGVSGGIGDYLALVRGSNGEHYMFRGVTRFDSGRLWVGNPVPLP